MNSVRRTLSQEDIRPRKKLGQSFLEDANMIRRIAALADAAGDDTVVEIGAGLGLLTAELAEKAGKVVAIEIDPRLVDLLRARFSQRDSVEIVAGDVLSYDFSSACTGRRIKVVGNIPYQISSPILFRLIEFRRSIASMILMFQKELADRIMAHPGTKDYGIPSVLVARYAAATRELTVPRTCFYPVPGVDSSVLRFVFRGEPPSLHEVFFAKTVKAAFSHRRKTLWNNLRATGIGEEVLEGVLARAGIDGMRRAETLSAGEFDTLARELYASENTEKYIDNQGVL